MPYLLETKKPLDLVTDPKLPPSPIDPVPSNDRGPAVDPVKSMVLSTDPQATSNTGLNPDSDVFQIRFTKEIFPSYEYVLDRLL